VAQENKRNLSVGLGIALTALLCIGPCALTCGLKGRPPAAWYDLQIVKPGMTVLEVMTVYPHDLRLWEKSLTGKEFLRTRRHRLSTFDGELQSEYPICEEGYATVRIEHGAVVGIAGTAMARHKQAWSRVKVGMTMQDVLEKVPVKFLIKGRQFDDARSALNFDGDLRDTFTGELTRFDGTEFFMGFSGYWMEIQFAEGRVTKTRRWIQED
jgi:hypothetical protein